MKMHIKSHAGESADKGRQCANIISRWKSLKAMHMNYILKRFLMETTLRCTWKLTQGEGRTNVHIAMQCIEEVLTNSSHPSF